MQYHVIIKLYISNLQFHFSFKTSYIVLESTIVHFKRLGSRCFYDSFERCYFFILNHYAYSKTKPQDIW